MVFTVTKSGISQRVDRTAVNDTCTLMAAVGSNITGISIHTRRHETLSWVQSATCTDALSERLLAGECVEHMAWGHPQFGNILAAATTMGRVLILSNRPDATQLVTGIDLQWHVCCVLLESGIPSYARRIMCGARTLTFAPAVMGLCLAVAHTDGTVHICPCAKPGLPQEASSWQSTYAIQPFLLTGNKCESRSAHIPTARQCIGLSWQPQMHAQQPFLAVATTVCVSVWCFERCLMDWVCVCSDIEAITRPSSDDGDISSVAWAPLMGRDAECIAVSRGAVVRLFAIQGLLQHATAEDSIQLRQVGQDMKHDSRVWKLAWDCLGMHLAVSCERFMGCEPSVSVWKLRLTGDLGDQRAFIVRAKGCHA